MPSPARSASGQRRYGDSDVALVLEVLRHRADGLGMPAAAQRALGRARHGETSVFAGLRRRHPDLRVQLLRKPAVLALSRAIEDECAAHADRPLLFAAFQRTDLYEASRRRWSELSRTALGTTVFADFVPGTQRTPAPDGVPDGVPVGVPVEVPVPFDSPLNREWVLVCDSEDQPGCVVGWERPGDPDGPEGDDRARRFETLWSVEPRVVRDAARLCAQLSETHLPGSTFAHWSALEGTPAPVSAETRRASGVLDRVLHYLARAVDQAG